MIIKIKKKPDMPIFDDLPEKFSPMFKGLFVQVATHYGVASYSGSTSSRAYNNKCTGHYYVAYQNLRNAITEKDPEFWHAIQDILIKHECDKIGFCFSSKEAKEVLY